MNTITDVESAQDFISKNEIALLYLSRQDCGVCKAIKPRVDEIAARHPEVKAAYIDLDETPMAAGVLNVFTIPAVLVYVRGRESIREARYMSIPDLESRIERYITLLA